MILKMQRDEYLPLKVIKERLLQQESAEGAPVEGEVETETEAPEELAEAVTGLQMSIEEMTAATGIDKERIKELESYGLVCAHGPEEPATTTATTTSCCRS
jgi:hypothetical protein